MQCNAAKKKNEYVKEIESPGDEQQQYGKSSCCCYILFIYIRKWIHLPVAKSVWCTSMVMAKTYSVSGNHTSFARAFQRRDMYDSCAESIRMPVQS